MDVKSVILGAWIIVLVALNACIVVDSDDDAEASAKALIIAWTAVTAGFVGWLIAT